MTLKINVARFFGVLGAAIILSSCGSNVATIPPQFHGSWAEVGQKLEGDSVPYQISSENVGWYEGGFNVTNVRIINNSKIQVTGDGQTEGEVFKTREQYTLLNEGKNLQIDKSYDQEQLVSREGLVYRLWRKNAHKSPSKEFVRVSWDNQTGRPSSGNTVNGSSEQSRNNSADSLMVGKWKSENFIVYDFRPDHTYTATWELVEKKDSGTWSTEGNKVYFGDATAPFMTFVNGKPQYYKDGESFRQIEN